MESGEDQLEMLELLASNCSKLRQDLAEANGIDEEQRLIAEYLKSNDHLHEPIADIPSGLDWCNVREPLSLDGNLKGKIVVLDFFTYCCINCMHILPDLAKLEEEFSVEKGLVVIGVHSAKFANEKDSKNIISAAQRYNILHPVVNDSQFQMWKRLKVHCWPTLLILGPRKNPLFVLMGEGHGKLLKKYVAASLKFYKDEIKSHPLPIAPSIELLKGRTMKFPAKVACNKKGLLAVSDSGNHRILIIGKAGEILHEIGGREKPGFKDGNFKECRFNSPQGVCYLDMDNEDDQAILFVADTENHAIRKIDLKNQIVETIVGTGRQGNDYQGGKTQDQSISSPWDVAMFRTGEGARVILIAMAGTHQIWAYFMDDCTWWKGRQYKAGECAAIAGNGHEENRNNSYPNNAAFAQPSGLAMDTKRSELFIADSESSSIRKLSLLDGKVSGVVGGDRNPQNLFAFGDLDGKQFNAKLQHPLGVCYNPQDNFIYVADTYNHKLKRIDPSTSTIETLDVKTKSEESFLFNEPGGLCVDETGENLLVANTNNHTIEMINLKVLEVFPIEIKSRDEMDVAESDLIYPRISVKTGEDLRLAFEIELSEGIHFTDGAPQKIHFEVSDAFTKEEKRIEANGKADFKWNLPEREITGKLFFKVRLSLCKDDLCFPKMFSLETTVDVKDSHPDSVVEQTFKVFVDKNSVRM